MSYTISISGNVDSNDVDKHREIVRAAIALTDALERAGVSVGGTVATPTTSTGLPPAIRVGKIEAGSTTPTGHKPK